MSPLPNSLVTAGRWLALTFALTLSLETTAITGRNPTGVNVKSTGATTVFITFQGLAGGQRAIEAFWCGDVTAQGVVATNPCVPGTILGSLPLRNDQSAVSGTGGNRDFTDIMTIPPSVARRAFQEALRGRSSEFFYVRRFENPNQFVTVTCRMAGGGARVPLALTDVRMSFHTEERKRPIFTVGYDRPLPPFSADIRYNGSGRLRGRWEVFLPGDIEPTPRDLLTEATLPIEDRALQRRYTLLERFEVYLPPTGQFSLPGPRYTSPPTTGGGLHKVLLRIEATDDKEGDSVTGTGIAVNSGGVAGFPLPTLPYFVGTPEELRPLLTPQAQIALMLPGDDARLERGQIEFSWVDVPNSSFYRLEVEDAQGAVAAALLKGETTTYSAPPWLQDRVGIPLRWRVIAQNAKGENIGKSLWRTFEFRE